MNYDALLSPEDCMYADSDEDNGYVAYNGNKGVNGGNGGGNAGEYYVPNDDAVILSPNTLVLVDLLDFRHHRQYNEFSLHSGVFWRDSFLHPMHKYYMDHWHHHEIFQIFQGKGTRVWQEARA